MTDTMLRVAADRLRDSLNADWRRGAPGKLTEVYDLALIYGEAAVRGNYLPCPRLPGQLQMELALAEVELD